MITIEILRHYKIGPFAIFDVPISSITELLLTMTYMGVKDWKKKSH